MFETEERRIAERIKDFVKDEKPRPGTYIMLRNGHILDIDYYSNMVNRDKINPQDAYVYIARVRTTKIAFFHYPLLISYDNFLGAYLSKLGFHFMIFAAPATDLKYIADATSYDKYLSIELVNLDIAVDNTNLRKFVFEVLGDKLVSREKKLTGDDYEKILSMFESQRLLAGHDFDGASKIIEEYYDKGNQSLAKEVARIVMDYYRIFDPYTICYDMKTWKEIDCSSINLD